jgi:hypothetical protein
MEKVADELKCHWSLYEGQVKAKVAAGGARCAECSEQP